jgi:hypothetical protein
VLCNMLKNGLCVGQYQYNNYSDLTSHAVAAKNSAKNNDTDPTLERPHLLGPGTHLGPTSGLHMLKLATSPSATNMVNAGFFNLGSASQISGSSFAAPAVMSAAVQAHLYEGAFSFLAYPVVNKAVILASTQDSNNDGTIGKSTVWFPQPSDAIDGAGQINLARTKQILDNDQYFMGNLTNTNFVSCGTNCRQMVIKTLAVPANARIRVALAFQACIQSIGGLNATLPNDLDLVVTQNASKFLACSGSQSSYSVTSEVEMVDFGPCNIDRDYSIIVRIKNGAALTACSATDNMERIGVAWSLRTPGVP